MAGKIRLDVSVKCGIVINMRPKSATCPMCRLREKRPGQSYCLPCGRAYKRRNYQELKSRPRKIKRERKPVCPRCSIRDKASNLAYCRPCMNDWRMHRLGRVTFAEREARPLILSPEVAAYAAGILDGEGCLTLSPRRRERKTPETIIAVGNTDRRLILWLHEHFGGSFRPMRPATVRCKPTWHWQLWSIEARRLLRAVRPYLVIKQRHADVLLAFYDALQARPVRERLVEPFAEPFCSLWDEIKRLNRKGPPSF